MNWLINLFYKLEECDSLILKIFLDIILNSDLKFLKKSELEENFIIRILMQKYEISESFIKICYINDIMEKKTGSISLEKLKDNQALEKIKQKNKNILENLIKIFDRAVLDFYLVQIFNKLKNRLNFEMERQNFKACCRLFGKIIEYFYEIMWFPFYSMKSDNQQSSSIYIILFLILIKSNSTKFFSEFLNYLNIKITFFNEFSNYLINCDFSILSESGVFSFQNYDSGQGHSKMIENFLFESITTCNLKFDENLTEMNEHKVIEKLKAMKNLIFLLENLVKVISKNQTILVNKINLMNIYSFYFSLQLKVKYYSVMSLLT
jgi:hypothetical protein